MDTKKETSTTQKQISLRERQSPLRGFHEAIVELDGESFLVGLVVYLWTSSLLGA